MVAIEYYLEAGAMMVGSIIFFTVGILHFINYRLNPHLRPAYRYLNRLLFTVLTIDGVVGSALAVDYKTVFKIYNPEISMMGTAFLHCTMVLVVVTWIFAVYELVLDCTATSFSKPVHNAVRNAIIIVFFVLSIATHAVAISRNEFKWVLIPYIYGFILVIFSLVVSIRCAVIFQKQAVALENNHRQQARNRSYKRVFCKLFTTAVGSVITGFLVGAKIILLLRTWVENISVIDSFATDANVYIPSSSIAIVIAVYAVMGFFGALFCWVPLHLKGCNANPTDVDSEVEHSTSAKNSVHSEKSSVNGSTKSGEKHDCVTRVVDIAMEFVWKYVGMTCFKSNGRIWSDSTTKVTYTRHNKEAGLEDLERSRIFSGASLLGNRKTGGQDDQYVEFSKTELARSESSNMTSGIIQSPHSGTFHNLSSARSADLK
jgi:hypothetical protein